jgi:hypothetical protein
LARGGAARSSQPGDQLIHQVLDEERAWPAEDNDGDVLAGSAIVSAGIARPPVHDRRVGQMDDLLQPAEIRSPRGVASEVEGATVVLDLADVRRVGSDGGPARRVRLDPTRHPVDLEAGRSCGHAELIVMSRERKSIEVVTNQQRAS